MRIAAELVVLVQAREDREAGCIALKAVEVSAHSDRPGGAAAVASVQMRSSRVAAKWASAMYSSGAR